MPRRKSRYQKIADLPFPTYKQKIERLQAKVDKNRQVIDAIAESHALHIALLGNFARHDLKNYIHSIDGIVSTYDAQSITDEQIKSIKYNLGLMRDTLNDFEKLIIHDGTENSCNMDELIGGIKILNRDLLFDASIDFQIENKVEEGIVFHAPFTSILQLLNNLIINATKALQSIKAQRKIKLLIEEKNSSLNIKVYDNGSEIPESIKNNLFDFGTSTTGGSGVGLFHARYLCEMLHGTIDFNCFTNHEFSKCFHIQLPLED